MKTPPILRRGQFVEPLPSSHFRKPRTELSFKDWVLTRRTRGLPTGATVLLNNKRQMI